VAAATPSPHPTARAYGDFGIHTVEATGETDDITPFSAATTILRCSHMRSSPQLR
jgi:hypothetical protein